MKAVITIAVFSSFICSTSSYAQEPTFGGGAGLKTCAEFANAYQTQPKLMENIFFTWAQGYMTGRNIWSDDRMFQIDLSVWAPDTQKSHIRDYCDEHPLKLYIEAVDDLSGSMKIDDVKIHGLEAIRQN